MSVLEQIRAASNRELARWLADCERKHPEFINTEARIKDEIRSRAGRKNPVYAEALAVMTSTSTITERKRA